MMMRKISFLVLVMVVLVQQAIGQVDFFQGSLNELQEKAESLKSIYFIDFYTDWCGYCKKMDKTTFVDPEVVEYVSKYCLAYKLNAEKGEGPEFTREMGVKGYPTIVIFDANGKVLEKLSGYCSKERLITALSKHKSKGKRVDHDHVNEDVLVSYLDAKIQFMNQLEKEVRADKGEQWVRFEAAAFAYGKARKVFEYDELLIEAEQTYGTKIRPYLELEYYKGKEKRDKVIELIEQLSAQGELSDNHLHLMVLNALNDRQIELVHLKWINRLYLKDKSDYDILDTRAAIQLSYGDIQDARDTAKKAKKIASKNKLDATSLEYLLEMTQ